MTAETNRNVMNILKLPVEMSRLLIREICMEEKIPVTVTVNDKQVFWDDGLSYYSLMYNTCKKLVETMKRVKDDKQ